MIDADGRCISSARDPPGQRSVYILPGDPEREAYRISTFLQFPFHCPVHPCHLAAAGFLFTGYKDRVRCFSCGQSVEDWVEGDDPQNSAWHRRSCELLSGTDQTNIPLSSIYRRAIRPQLRTSEASTNALSSEAGTSNFTDHRRLDNRFEVVRESSLAQPLASTLMDNGSIDQQRALSHHLADLFPCRNPVNPHMENEMVRLQTFRDRVQKWPAHRIEATPEQMASAGLYYIGERDRVKCWYCNGGLQNWDRFDDPWFEHAKWFPKCEFVLQRKGPEFVHDVVARFPNINRSQVVRPTTLICRQNARSNRITEAVPTEERFSNSNSHDAQLSQTITEIEKMGFDRNEIHEAMERQRQINSQSIPTASELVDLILAKKSENQETTRPKLCSSQDARTTENPRQLLNVLKESRLCKRCRNAQSVMVLLPCGHLVCCENCGKNVRTCPLCKSRVKQTIRSFMG